MDDQLTTATTFAITPTWVLDHPQLSDRAVRLYGVLARYADQRQAAWPARTTLAERLRCSTDSIDRAVRELVAAGAVSVERRRGPDGAPTSNLYRLAVTQPPEGVAAGVRPPSRTGAATVAAGVPTEREPLEREPQEREKVKTLAPADADARQLQQQVAAIEQLPEPDQLPIRAVPGRTLTSQLVRYGLAQGDLTDAELQRARDRVDVHRLALRLAEQHTEGTQRTRVATQLATEYLGAALGAEPAEVAEAISPAARRLLGRLCATTTPGSVLRYLDVAVQSGAGLRAEDDDEGLAIAKYASAVHRRERAEGSNPLVARRAGNS